MVFDSLKESIPFLKTPRLEIAVTGLRRAGKTAFITSAIHNLRAFSNNKKALERLCPPNLPDISTAIFFSDQSGRVPVFPYTKNMEHLVAGEWPPPTDAVSKAEVGIRYMAKSTFGPPKEASLHISFIDYPGEWLLDIAMESTYDAWAERTLAEMRKPSRARFAEDYRNALQRLGDPAAPADPYALGHLHSIYVEYLTRCRDAGLVNLQPGRYLMPPEGAKPGSIPVFAPIEISPAVKFDSKSLGAEMRRQYAKYLEECVNDFYEQTFQSSGSQVILVDLIGAINNGRHAFEDTCAALKAVYAAINRKKNESWFSWLFTPQYKKVVFAVTKADHVPETKRSRLQSLLEKILFEEEDAAKRAGAQVTVTYTSSVRCTVDDTVERDVGEIEVVVGIPVGSETRVKTSVGTIPDTPPTDEFWTRREQRLSEGKIAFPTFKPPVITEAIYNGVPHVGLDNVLCSLLKDEIE